MQDKANDEQMSGGEAAAAGATAGSTSTSSRTATSARSTSCRRTRRRHLIGAIDQGTSSTRFLVFENGSGRLVASSQLEIKRIVPKEGWVEIDPNEIMDSVYKTIELTSQQLGGGAGGASKLKCIGICNQRESAVVWDSRSGQALYNVIVWMDNRTKDLVDDMIDSVPGRDFNFLKDKTGLPMSTYFSAFKLKWLIDNVSAVKEALRDNRLLFGTVDSWILWNLTGLHLTDVTNASRTFLMNIETLEWSRELCRQFGVPMNILPKILASADDFGLIRHGPLRGLPITGVIGDQSAALFGHNCLQVGQTKATFGTGCFIMQNIGPGPLKGALSGVQREAKRGLITTVGFKLRDQPACYALEGSIKIAGAALAWLRDNIQLINNYDECDMLVDKTTNSAGVFFVPALGGLYSPYWDPNAAGLFIGLSQFTRREHLVRATFDSVAFQTNDILSLMRGVTSGLMIDGGLCKSDNMCQILADITGCAIVRPSMCETSALGAAMVAGCGASIWSYESILNASSTIAAHRLTPEPAAAAAAAAAADHHRHQQRQLAAQPTPVIDLHQQQQETQAVLQINNLDAGGGVNDDAGGGHTRPDHHPDHHPDHLHHHHRNHHHHHHRNHLNNNIHIDDDNSNDATDDDHDDSYDDPDDDPLLITSISSAADSLVDSDEDGGVTTSGEFTATSSEEGVAAASAAAIAAAAPGTIHSNPEIPECPTAGSGRACGGGVGGGVGGTKLLPLVAGGKRLRSQTTGRSSDYSSGDNCDNLAALDELIEVSSAANGIQLARNTPITCAISTISAEQRKQLVDTWRQAVERSMQWTKVHHEEVRRADYQRLSSMPISMYLFVSIGIVALSGFLSAPSPVAPVPAM